MEAKENTIILSEGARFPNKVLLPYEELVSFHKSLKHLNLMHFCEGEKMILCKLGSIGRNMHSQERLI